MNLGDVTKKSIPKVSLLAPAKNGGVIATRTFIPHRASTNQSACWAAVSVATACVVPGSVAQEIAGVTSDGSAMSSTRHPTGYFSVSLEVSITGGDVHVDSAALVRTARLLMRGDVLVPPSIWQVNDH